MKFYIEYSCPYESEQMIVECDSEVTAEEYAAMCAREIYELYAGLHGVTDLKDVAWEEFCKELEELTDEEQKIVEERYEEIVSDDTSFYVEEFDEINECHLTAMEDGVYEIQ